MIEPKYIWKYDSYQDIWNPKKVSSYNISPLLKKLLSQRNITTPEAMKRFLEPSIENLHDPFLLQDMKQAIQRIEVARVQQEKIMIYGDYDVDGITSTVILYSYLNSNGWDVDYYIPNRLEEGYGLNKEALTWIYQQGTNLVITVDTGITAIEEVAYGNQLGLDIIITDHHECQETLPSAYAVINPKRKDSLYPFSSLAGVGVTFKLLQALAIKAGNKEEVEQFLDIVALGTIADVVPLVDENRIIAKIGLEQMKKKPHLGIEALLKISGYDGKSPITSGIVGFRLAPRLNAAGRLGDAKKGVELFLASTQEEAITIAERLDIANQERQSMEQKILKEALEIIEDNKRIQEDKVLVVASEKWHHGVLGIVASRLMEQFYRPVILLCIEEEYAKGSARSVEGFNLFDSLCHTQGFLEKFGGHEMAAGLTISADKIEPFRQAINAYAEKVMKKDTLIPKLSIVEDISHEHITLDFIEELESLEPYGEGNPQPIFSYVGKIAVHRAVGKEGKHLKLQLNNGFNQNVDGIGFGLGPYHDQMTTDETLQIAGIIERNEWNGEIKPQFIICDMKSDFKSIIREKYEYSLYHLFADHPFEPAIKNDEDTCTPLENIVLTEKTLVMVHTWQAFQDALQWCYKHSSYEVKLYYRTLDSDFKISNSIHILVNGWVDTSILKQYHQVIVWDLYWIKGQQKSLQNNTISIISLDLYQHKKQLSVMLPQRKDFENLYRYLQRLDILQQQKISSHKLYHEIQDQFQMSLFTALHCLDIFQELDLLQYQYNRKTFSFAFGSQEKTSLQRSTRYQKLQRWKQLYQ
ncbi:MAG: single-stranded-DNA-specific exonuclease RecJ [Epulopiscium sp.]|nr:single-stranded-DNA-specific exonuclease RecJ [Candidatus Epulonipiscium sp.]